MVEHLDGKKKQLNFKSEEGAGLSGQAGAAVLRSYELTSG